MFFLFFRVGGRDGGREDEPARRGSHHVWCVLSRMKVSHFSTQSAPAMRPLKDLLGARGVLSVGTVLYDVMMPARASGGSCRARNRDRAPMALSRVSDSRAPDFDRLIADAVARTLCLIVCISDYVD